MQDAKIIDLFFARSEQALSETQTKYGRLCSQIAYGILSNHEDAEEAVNTAYAKLWDAIPPAKPKSLCGYLCATVRNIAINAYNALKRRPCDELYDELAEVIPDSKTVETEYDSHQISVYLNEFLGKTSKKSREIFVSRYYYNMSINDISNAMEMTESAIKTRLSRTRTELREYLEERGVDI